MNKTKRKSIKKKLTNRKSKSIKRKSTNRKKSTKTKKIITKEQAKKLGKLFKINFKVVPFNEFLFGLNVELEHGTINKKTNVSDDDPIITSKISLAHLEEDPRYYYHLKKMELKSEKYYKTHKKPSVYKK
jgi:hypothetical protein